jgi:hypothetical protein
MEDMSTGKDLEEEPHATMQIRKSLSQFNGSSRLQTSIRGELF